MNTAALQPKHDARFGVSVLARATGPAIVPALPAALSVSPTTAKRMNDHELREERMMAKDVTCATEGHLWGPLGRCVMCGHPAPPPGIPLVSGIGRDAECKNALVIYCSREPTDDEVRAIHDAVRITGHANKEHYQQ